MPSSSRKGAGGPFLGSAFLGQWGGGEGGHWIQIFPVCVGFTPFIPSLLPGAKTLNGKEKERTACACPPSLMAHWVDNGGPDCTEHRNREKPMKWNGGDLHAIEHPQDGAKVAKSPIKGRKYVRRIGAMEGSRKQEGPPHLPDRLS